MEKWEIEEHIRALQELNKDECERPEIKKQREAWIEHFKQMIKLKEDEI